MTRVSIGLDLGTHLGWAMRCETYSAGEIDLAHASLRQGHYVRYGDRFAALQRWLSVVLADNTMFVAYEKVDRHLGTQAAHVYGGLESVLHIECDKKNIACVGISVKQVKKYATGNGNATKSEMVSAAEERWPGVSGGSHNAADALWVLEKALSLFDGGE